MDIFLVNFNLIESFYSHKLNNCKFHIMFSCLEDSSYEIKSSSPLQNNARSIQNERILKNEDLIERYAFEGRELRKKIKHLSNKIFQLESERCTERLQFQKEIEAKNSSCNSEIFESRRVNELLQLKGRFEMDLAKERKENENLKLLIDEKEKEIKNINQVYIKNDHYYEEKLKAGEEEIKKLKEEFEDYKIKTNFQRERIINDNSSILLRRAMIAEAEVEKLRNEINSSNNSMRKEPSSDKINELNGQIKLLVEKNENLLVINNEYEVELRDKSEKINSLENNLEILKNENENLGKLLNDLIISKDKVIESVKKVTEENRYLHNFLHEKEISRTSI